MAFRKSSARLLSLLVMLLASRMAVAAEDSHGRDSSFSFAFVQGGVARATEPSDLKVRGIPGVLAYGFGHQFDRQLALEFEVVGAGAAYDAPPPPSTSFVSYGDHRELEMQGGTLTIRRMSHWGRYRPFVRAGVAYFRVAMTVRSTVPELQDDLTGSQGGIHPLAGVGIDTSVGRWYWVGLEIAHVWVSENLGVTSNGEPVGIPTHFLFTLGRDFGP